MKIGILTYHRAYNYGAFLQAYALKAFLVKCGNEADFVDYWPYEHEKKYRIGKINGIKPFIRSLIVLWRSTPRYKRFRVDQQKYLKIGAEPLFRNGKQLEELDYDVIIYGSDQIWWKSRLGDNGFDPVYWGQFVKNDIKKVAYAASMGIIDLTEKDKNEITNYLKAFSHISVRENQLKNALQPLTDKTIRTVLDPTLLMPSGFWESFCGQLRPVKGKYILYYKMMNAPCADVFAIKTGRILNLPVITVFGHMNTYKANKISSVTDVASFVALIRNAEYVVSSSFHGVAMSIQFKKEFYAMGMDNNSDRVSSLLSKLGLENRLTDVVPDSFSKKINYSEVHSKLHLLQKESSDFLTSSILL